jgi:hypothetical protein
VKSAQFACHSYKIAFGDPFQGGLCGLERNSALTNTSKVQPNADRCQFSDFYCTSDTRFTVH